MNAAAAVLDSPFFRGSSPLPLLFGHRGTREHAPENTMAAFLWAQQAGADGVELDIRLCGSGELVVFHDADLKRVANLAWEVADTPLIELAMVDLGDGQGIPLLTDVLDEMLARGLLVNIEVKADGQDVDALDAAVAAVLLARPQHDLSRLCVSSFSRRALSAVELACPHVPVATLCETAERLPSLDPDAAAVAAAPRGVHPHHGLLSDGWVHRARAGGRFVNAWTVNDPAIARRLAADGVDGLITDDVAALRRAM